MRLFLDEETLIKVKLFKQNHKKSLKLEWKLATPSSGLFVLASDTYWTDICSLPIFVPHPYTGNTQDTGMLNIHKKITSC